MATFIEFVSRLIYGSGAEAVITPNHRQWVLDHNILTGSDPSGTDWLDHFLDEMLVEFESWSGGENLPPIYPWDGFDPTPWPETSTTVPIPASLDGSFIGISSENDLGVALWSHYKTVAGPALELNGTSGLVKAPFSHRFWGFLKWAHRLRARYRGEIVLPPAVMRDFDGTILSAMPFLDKFNDLHWNWHFSSTGAGAGPATQPTPGFKTPVGQRASNSVAGTGLTLNDEFIQFHREHIWLYHRWLERRGEAPIPGFNALLGWPQNTEASNNPSTWTEPGEATVKATLPPGTNLYPWVNDPSQDTDQELKALSDLEVLGSRQESYAHGTGHGANNDFAPIQHNNYSPRFFLHHGWIDNQWWFREPRFGRWNATTHLRERTFDPVIASGAELNQPWPGLPALTIVRDPSGGGDTVFPVNAVKNHDPATGAGELRMKFVVNDSYNRDVIMNVRAEAFDDAIDPTTPVETGTQTLHIGSDAAADHPLDMDFFVDLPMTTAFRSDDPGGGSSNPVGFVNSRVRVSATLTVWNDPATATNESDPSFEHEDFVDIDLIQEKDAPDVDVYLNLSTFGENQVQSAMTAGEARFDDAIIIAVQDRTTDPHMPMWPGPTMNEVKGLLRRRPPASGLFDDPALAPAPVIWRPIGSDTEFTGLTVELSSGPVQEDSTLPDNIPQRFVYRYDVVFNATNDAFAGLATGASQLGRLRVEARDRSGNRTTETINIQLLKDANPYMTDGDPSWLSIDTRVFRIFEGDTMFSVTKNSATDPNTFIQNVLTNLNNGTAGTDTFDGLATNQPDSALEYSQEITNPSTGTSAKVYNFALAKVRLQGTDGAEDVRAFFRLFTYAASRLVFDASKGYRTFSDLTAAPGTTVRRVPRLGFTNEAPGGEVISIPFFAAPRVSLGTPMDDQLDDSNIQTFPVSADTGERVLYFGVWLDINQDSIRLPLEWIAANPDGGFTSGETQPIRDLMKDAHQCMVVELVFDGDPTEPGTTPSTSDNLAQRNLLIVETDNPGDAITHTVQHSFLVDTSRFDSEKEDKDLEGELIFDPDGRRDTGDDDVTHDHRHMLVPTKPPGIERGATIGIERPTFITVDERPDMVHAEAMAIAMTVGPMMTDLTPFAEVANARVDRRFPFVFDRNRWLNTSKVIDELMFEWNDLPTTAYVELYFPRIQCEDIMNLRSIRHAPGDVRIIDSHTLLLRPEGPTFVPMPPTPDGRIAGLVTIALPERIREGQEWQIDVSHLRGGTRQVLGGFQVDIKVSNAKQIAEAETRLLEMMFKRLSYLNSDNIWYPVMLRRTETIRTRAKALAVTAGLPWQDPTHWGEGPSGDPEKDTNLGGVVRGREIRIILEKIEIIDDRDPWIKGRGEVWFVSRVRSRNNGGNQQDTRVPERGVIKVSDKPSENVIHLEREIFRGWVEDDLAIQVTGTEEDTFDPDDPLGKYSRLFCGNVRDWYGSYGPSGEPIDPEDVGAWRIFYRIEPA